MSSATIISSKTAAACRDTIAEDTDALMVRERINRMADGFVDVAVKVRMRCELSAGEGDLLGHVIKNVVTATGSACSTAHLEPLHLHRSKAPTLFTKPRAVLVMHYGDGKSAHACVPQNGVFNLPWRSMCYTL